MLSLSMLVRDEAERLAACLASVADFVDEMVIVDTGSVDDSVAVARSCGATVHQLPWPGDFAPARNHALTLCRGDWVLVLDADERLLPEPRQELRRRMAEPDLLVITLLRQELGARQSPYSSVSRLFRRHPALVWSGAYHASIDDSVAALCQREPGWRLGHCARPALLHEGYRPELLASRDKARRLRQAMEAELAQRPGDPYICAKLGALELAEGQHQLGLRLLEQGLRHCPDGAEPERFELLLHLGIAHAESDPDRAIGYYLQAMALPLDCRLTLAARLNLAALLLERGAWDAAREQALAVTEAAPELVLGWYNLGLIERRRGRLPEAIAADRRALQRDPDHAESHQNLAVAALLSGDIASARAGFRDAILALASRGDAAAAAALRESAGALVKLDG
ncbi:MAG: glycosyltransferase [Synechococcaceae cyanobacterium]